MTEDSLTPVVCPVINADLAPCFTSASYQNAIPVVRSIINENHSPETF